MQKELGVGNENSKVYIHLIHHQSQHDNWKYLSHHHPWGDLKFKAKKYYRKLQMSIEKNDNKVCVDFTNFH